MNLNRSAKRAHSIAITMGVVIGPLIGGCSCSRRPEWDSGLRDSEPESSAAQSGASSMGGGAPVGEGSGTGGASEAGEGGASGGGSGQSPGAGGAAVGAGKGGEGSGGSGSSGDASKGVADGGGGKEGGSVAGNQTRGKGGTAGDESLRPAALPGRPRPKPLYDAHAAAEVAERRLRQAETHRSDGDKSNAYGVALEAFEAVEPHAATDDACRQLLGRAKRILADLAESLNRESPTRAVPTYFQ